MRTPFCEAFPPGRPARAPTLAPRDAADAAEAAEAAGQMQQMQQRSPGLSSPCLSFSPRDHSRCLVKEAYMQFEGPQKDTHHRASLTERPVKKEEKEVPDTHLV
ncbi:hypothetical protein PVPAM_070034700 [Plasmodium vivax]|nr:hypothetical protein PVPAM_070034700 [Plasmodium vivax]